MSKLQLPKQCAKCGYNFLAVDGGSEFSYCPKCGQQRVRLAERADGEPTSNGSPSANGFTSNDQENPVTTNINQSEVHHSTIETFSVVKNAAIYPSTDSDNSPTELEGVSIPRPPITELAKTGVASAEKSSVHKEQNETEQLMADESDSIPEPGNSDAIIDHTESDHAPTQTDGAGEVEKRFIPEHQTPEGITNSSAVSSSDHVR